MGRGTRPGGGGDSLLGYSVLSCEAGLAEQCRLLTGCGVGTQARLSPALRSSPSLPAIRPEGKNNRLFVFSISMASVAHWSLDVAADSQEELQDWVKKIREVAQTADARVRACRWPSEQWGSPRPHR